MRRCRQITVMQASPEDGVPFGLHSRFNVGVRDYETKRRPDAFCGAPGVLSGMKAHISL